MLLNRPVLIAPRFGLDDSAHSDFDATLVLATMMSSQLHGADESTGQARDAANQNSAGPSCREGSQGRATSHDSAGRGNGSEMTPGSAHRSDETAIWSDLSGLPTIPLDTYDLAIPEELTMSSAGLVRTLSLRG